MSLLGVGLSVLAVIIAAYSVVWTRARTLPEITVVNADVSAGDVIAAPGIDDIIAVEPEGGDDDGGHVVEMVVEAEVKNAGDVSAALTRFRVDHLDSGFGVDEIRDDRIVNSIGPGSSWTFSYIHPIFFGADEIEEIDEELDELEEFKEAHLDDRPQYLLIHIDYEAERDFLSRPGDNQYALRYDGGGEFLLTTTEEELEEIQDQLPEIYNFLSN